MKSTRWLAPLRVFVLIGLATTPVAAGEITATGGPLGLGSVVNGLPGGSCFGGACAIQGGTSAGANLFHRFSAFDTRGGITGVSLDVAGHRNVMVGVTHPLGSFIDKAITLSSPANLVWLSPGGIRLSGAGTFTNVQHLNLTTATGLRVGEGRFDVHGTTAAAAASLTGAPVLGLSGLSTDPATLNQLGLSAQGDLAIEGGLLTVDGGLLLDAQGGHVLLGGSRLQAPGGQLALQGQQVSLQNTTVDVSSLAGAGGSISLSGQQVSLVGSSLLATGRTAGGVVRVGADPLGTVTALSTTVDATSTLRADATSTGPGGRILVLGKERADVAGAISARGGLQGGDGGFVETSAGWLALSTSPDLSAARGRGGTWLIDPRDIEIVAAGPGGGPPPGGTPGGLPGSASLIDVSLINTALNGGQTVIVDTTDPVGTQAGNISLLAPVQKSTGANATLDLRADGNILINIPGANPVAFSSTSATGRLDVNLWYQKTADAATPAGSISWEKGAVDINTGTLRALQGASRIDGNIELTGLFEPFKLLSGTVRTGEFGWSPASRGEIQLSSFANPKPAILDVSRRYTQGPDRIVTAFSTALLQIGPSAQVSSIDGGTFRDVTPVKKTILKVSDGATLALNQASISGPSLAIESGAQLQLSGSNQLANLASAGSILIAPNSTLNLQTATISPGTSIVLQGNGSATLRVDSASFRNDGTVQGSGEIVVGSGQGSFTNGGSPLPGAPVALLDPIGSLVIRAASFQLADNSQLLFDLSTADQLSIFGDTVLGGGLEVASPPIVGVATPFDLIRAQAITGAFIPNQTFLPIGFVLQGVAMTGDPLLPAIVGGSLAANAPPPLAPPDPPFTPSPPFTPNPPTTALPPQTVTAPQAPSPSPEPSPAPTPSLLVPDLGYQLFAGTQTSPFGSSLSSSRQGVGTDALAVNLSEADFSLADGAVTAPAPLTVTTTTLSPDLVASALSDGDQQRTEDVRRTLGDVGTAADSDGTLRLEELQRLLSKASQKGDKDDERFNPAVLMVSFTEQQETAGQEQKPPAAQDQKALGATEKKPTNSFLDLILLSRKGEPFGQRVELSRERFGQQLRALYRQLARLEPLDVENPESPSRQIHRALIAPLAEELKAKGITTLVIVADRGLQGLPFAALHDGASYFGDQFGFSITPSLNLTSFGPPRLARGRVLAAGASEFEGLSPLPLVPEELAGIPDGVGIDRFLNKNFTPEVLLSQAADPRYERLHVATHAEFMPGGPSQARIFTGTGSVSLQEFARLRQQRSGSPLELFVLSACRTALGDSDSELGFAGLALQAGSRSAIGTLWYVDDVATSAYFLQLYRYLDQGVQKADALRATRQAMATGKVRLEGDKVIGSDGVPLLTELTPSQRRRVASGMAHPYFWAGVQLIGTPW
ncbi:CHAT domain-containing protein [Cyanobium gracile]|uniref:CHAT domain-containing protein n=1 Tax=Cyanobium gracile UHCC 0281 TaxID=3110309 RepID=A0ABU5SUC3_9CYAN|nr:CHAT domain-containing protein [Cyanobium gracile]MEA5441947.1 CHAT domain-containing protein [Cyanobium gracile UHCC 0281]